MKDLLTLQQHLENILTEIEGCINNHPEYCDELVLAKEYIEQVDSLVYHCIEE